jgi:hypothetical protein
VRSCDFALQSPGGRRLIVILILVVKRQIADSLFRLLPAGTRANSCLRLPSLLRTVFMMSSIAAATINRLKPGATIEAILGIPDPDPACSSSRFDKTSNSVWQRGPSTSITRGGGCADDRKAFCKNRFAAGVCGLADSQDAIVAPTGWIARAKN